MQRWLILGFLVLCGCSEAGSGGAVAPNQVEALGLDRPHADLRVQALVDDAQDWYALYLQSGDEELWRRHAAASEGALQLLTRKPTPPAPMPTTLDAVELDMPYGRG